MIPKGCVKLPPNVLPGREVFERAGFQFLEEGNTAIGIPYVLARMPDGWVAGYEGLGNESSIWDSQGRRRVEYMRSAGFLDDGGKAHMLKKFDTAMESDDSDGGMWLVVREFPLGEVKLRIGKAPRIEGRLDWARMKELYRQAEEDMDRHYPNHRDPLAYWDEAP